MIAPALFRGYDIRGRAPGELDDEAARVLARAFARLVAERGAGSVWLGRDGRPSGQRLADAIGTTLRGCGLEVIELGVVPTPLVYFAAASDPGAYGISVTASHLSAEWNGAKFVAGAHAIHTDELRARLEGPAPVFASGPSSRTRERLLARYLARFGELLWRPSGLRVVLDPQAAAACELAPASLRPWADISLIHAEPLAGYPFGTPDPAVARHLEPLSHAVLERGAELGLAFDGDADRLGVVDERGRRVAPDALLALFAQDLLAREPGAAVVADVLCSPLVEETVRAAGGRYLEAPSGHAEVAAAMNEGGAPLGGESSGHYFLADGYRSSRLAFDDGIWAGARLLELVARCGPLGALVDALPATCAGEEWRPRVPDERKRALAAAVGERLAAGGRVSRIDGWKVFHPEGGWTLVRAANTEPCLSVRTISPDRAALDRREDAVRLAVAEAAAELGVALG